MGNKSINHVSDVAGNYKYVYDKAMLTSFFGPVYFSFKSANKRNDQSIDRSRRKWLTKMGGRWKYKQIANYTNKYGICSIKHFIWPVSCYVYWSSCGTNDPLVTNYCLFILFILVKVYDISYYSNFWDRNREHSIFNLYLICYYIESTFVWISFVYTVVSINVKKN